MDAVSVTIIVVVLSVGSFLVYLSNSDLERRRKLSLVQVQSLSKNKGQKQNVSNSKRETLRPRELNQLKQSSKSKTLQSSNFGIDAKISDDTPDSTSTNLGPVFDTKVKTIESKQKKQTSNSKCKKDIDLLVGPLKADQLLALMASSNLNREEIELAIETLLGRLEAGDSNWKQAKSDSPLYRLKTRIREHETALTAEIANHESTRAKLGVIDSSLDQARCELSKQRLVQKQLIEENNKLLTELETLRCDLTKQQLLHKQLEDEMFEQLERARGDLCEQQMAQKRFQEDRFQVIERLEEDKAQLQTMMLELQMINGRQEEMLRRQSDERLENEASMRGTLLEMELELKELQMKLSANSTLQDERLRKALKEMKANQGNSNKRSKRNSNSNSNDNSILSGKKDIDRKFFENFALFCLRCLD